MATELLEENLTQPAQETVDAPPADPAPSEQVPPKAPKEKQELLRPLLTILLILLGIGEAAFWGYFAFSSYRNSLALERYEEQQRALEEERASNGIVGGSAYGPNWKVENGTVTWERETKLSAGSNLTGDSTPRREDGLRLSYLAVPNIPYTLAEMDGEARSVPEQTPAPAEDETTPTNA